MKKILLLICFLTSLSALAQPSNSSQYQVQPARWKMTKPLWLDSGSYVKNIAKYSNQNRVCVFDSTTGKVGYRYISGSTNYNAGNGILIGSSIIYADTNLLWSTHGNSGAPNRSFGTTNNTSVRVITNNLLRFILDSNGRFGQGKYPTVQFDATSSSSYGMNLTSTLNSGSTDLRLSNDLSRGLRITQFGSTATGNLCGVIAKANASQIRFGGGNDPIVMVGDGNSPVYFGNNTAVTLTVQNINNRIGVKKQTPIFGLDVNATVAINRDSLPTATNLDSVVMIGSNNQLKKRPFTAFSGSGSTYYAGNGLLLGGATFYIDSTKVPSLYGNNWGSPMFSGSKNNSSVNWRTNNLYAMTLDSNQRLGVGVRTPSYKLDVLSSTSGSASIAARIKNAGSGWFLGNYGSNYAAIWSTNITPSTSNYALISNGSSTYINGSSEVVFATSDGVRGNWKAAGLNIGNSSTAVSQLTIPIAATATSNYGLVSLGTGPFNGSGGDCFVGSPNGTVIAINRSGTGNQWFANYQLKGVSKFSVDSVGTTTIAGNLLSGGNVVVTGATSTIVLKGYTVATLPTGVLGATAFVTDASGPSYLATVVGGGSVKCPVFYDGTNWVCH